MPRYRKKRDRVALFALVAVLIIVAVIVLVFKPTNSCPMPITKTFRFSMSGFDDGKHRYIVDGIVTPTLHLKNGKKYRFVLDKEAHPLYLTISNVGGASVPGSIATNVDERGLVDSGGELFVIPNKDATPGELYYQSTKIQGAGGRIIIG